MEVCAVQMQCRAKHRGDSAHTETERDMIERTAPDLTRGAEDEVEPFFAVPARAELQRQASSLARATQLCKLSGQVVQECSSCTTNKRRHKRKSGKFCLLSCIFKAK